MPLAYGSKTPTDYFFGTKRPSAIYLGSKLVWPPVQSGTETTNLAFNMPAPTNNKKVLAHYFPPYPVSLDNANPASDYYETGYLTPGGEGGKHSAYGGLLRDRPLPRAVRTESDYKTENFKDEIRQAIAAGIDGFVVDILVSKNTTGNPVYDTPIRLLNAAAAVSTTFKIFLMPDMTGAFSSFTAIQLRDELIGYASHAAVGKHTDGTVVIAPYYAEGKPASFWADFKTYMNSLGQPASLMLCFLDATQTNQTNYSSVAMGYGNWGNRNPAGNPLTTATNSPRDLMAKAQALGKLWMQPVSVQDSRPNQQIYDEAENSTNLRNTWEIACSGADWVQLVTWNDYSENAAFAPSRRHGWSILDISQYWLAKFRTGSFPTIVRDTIYLSHRTQPYTAVPTYSSQYQYQNLRSGSSAARNTIEVVAFLTAAGTVNIKVDSTSTAFVASAGLNVFVIALNVGVISANIVRNSVTVQTTTTPYPATNSPYVQTLDYIYSSSRR